MNVNVVTIKRYTCLLFGVVLLTTSLGAQITLHLSDTVSFNSSEVGETTNRFGIGNRAIALMNHYEGKTLIYSPTNEFRAPPCVENSTNTACDTST